jgi:hypothetical protein
MDRQSDGWTDRQTNYRLVDRWTDRGTKKRTDVQKRARHNFGARLRPIQSKMRNVILPQTGDFRNFPSQCPNSLDCSCRQRPRVNVIKLFFPLSLMTRPNKLACLSLETLSNQVLEFEGKARANPIGAHFRCLLLG